MICRQRLSNVLEQFLLESQTLLQLHTMGIGACEKAGIDGHGFHLHFQKAKLMTGETIISHTGPLMGLKWVDKRQVVMLSIIHDDTIIEKSRRTRT